jgi:hypothetical protein
MGVPFRADLREGHRLSVARAARRAEIDQHRPAILPPNRCLRLDVPMQQFHIVHATHGTQDVAQDIAQLGIWNAADVP